MDWKKNFLERYAALTDMDRFIEFSEKPLRKSIRVNTIKTSVREMRKRFDFKPVPWCDVGFFVEGRAIGNTLEHFLGYIYLQEAASMIPPVVLNPSRDDLVLDMCASPGSKTTQMAAMMNNKGLIIANDNAISRLKPLSMNLQRCGVSNVVMTLMEGRWFKTGFDKILVDAPCSGTGTIRKSPKTVGWWNPNFIRQMAGIQKQLLDTAFTILKPNGTLVYSTCSLEPEEDESVVDSLLQRHDDARLQKISLDIKSSPAVLEFGGDVYDSEIKKCLRIWPQDSDTEGFFVAKVKKV